MNRRAARSSRPARASMATSSKNVTARVPAQAPRAAAHPRLALALVDLADLAHDPGAVVHEELAEGLEQLALLDGIALAALHQVRPDLPLHGRAPVVGVDDHVQGDLELRRGP